MMTIIKDNKILYFIKHVYMLEAELGQPAYPKVSLIFFFPGVLNNFDHSIIFGELFGQFLWGMLAQAKR